MDKIKLNIVGLSHSTNELGAYALILGEKDSTRKIPIIIARAEAMAIAFSLENKKHMRPFTHDLLRSIIAKMGGELLEVLLSKVESGIFYADIKIAQGGEVFSMSARPSDAVALAIKYKAPVYATLDVVKKASFDFDEDFEELEEKKGLKDYSVEEIETMLKAAIDKEDYEKAGVLKEEIDRRREGNDI